MGRRREQKADLGSENDTEMLFKDSLFSQIQRQKIEWRLPGAGLGMGGWGVCLMGTAFLLEKIKN